MQTLEITGPNEVWVADITYIRLRREFVFLAVLLDIFTRARMVEREVTMTFQLAAK